MSGAPTETVLHTASSALLPSIEAYFSGTVPRGSRMQMQTTSEHTPSRLTGLRSPWNRDLRQTLAPLHSRSLAACRLHGFFGTVPKSSHPSQAMFTSLPLLSALEAGIAAVGDSRRCVKGVGRVWYGTRRASGTWPAPCRKLLLIHPVSGELLATLVDRLD